MTTDSPHPRDLAVPAASDVATADLARRVGVQLRAEWRARGLSLDQLAVASGVGHDVLSQIDELNADPPLEVLRQIAVGLGLSFADLVGTLSNDVVVLRGRAARLLACDGDTMESRPLIPAGTNPWVEMYELRLAAHAAHSSKPHPPGAVEILAVLDGELRLRLGEREYDLGTGDTVSFRADVTHTYENSSSSQGRYHATIVHAH